MYITGCFVSLTLYLYLCFSEKQLIKDIYEGRELKASVWVVLFVGAVIAFCTSWIGVGVSLADILRDYMEW